MLQEYKEWQDVAATLALDERKFAMKDLSRGQLHTKLWTVSC